MEIYYDYSDITVMDLACPKRDVKFYVCISKYNIKEHEGGKSMLPGCPGKSCLWRVVWSRKWEIFRKLFKKKLYP